MRCEGLCGRQNYAQCTVKTKNGNLEVCNQCASSGARSDGWRRIG